MTINNKTIGWGIIGRSSGLQTKTAGCIAGFDIKNLVDLHNTYINLYPNTELFCFFRENRNGTTVSYYLNYRPAKEIKIDRNGAFYGSVLVLVNARVAPEVAYAVLKELSDYVGTFINPDNKFIKNIDDIDCPQPPSLAAISAALSPINPNMSIGTNEGFRLIENLDKNTICQFFSSAEDTNTTHYFSKVYAASSREIAEFVKSRQKIIVFEPATLKLQFEIDKIKAEKAAVDKQVADLTNEKNALIAEYQQHYNNLMAKHQSLSEENSRIKIQLQNLQDTNKSKLEIDNLKRHIQQLESDKLQKARDFDNLKSLYHQSINNATASGYQKDAPPSSLKEAFDDMAQAIFDNSGKLLWPALFIIFLGIALYMVYVLFQTR